MCHGKKNPDSSKKRAQSPRYLCKARSHSSPLLCVSVHCRSGSPLCICAGTMHAFLLSHLSLKKFKVVKDGDYVQKPSSDFKSVTALRDR